MTERLSSLQKRLTKVERRVADRAQREEMENSIGREATMVPGVEDFEER